MLCRGLRGLLCRGLRQLLCQGLRGLLCHGRIEKEEIEKAYNKASRGAAANKFASGPVVAAPTQPMVLDAPAAKRKAKSGSHGAKRKLSQAGMAPKRNRADTLIANRTILQRLGPNSFVLATDHKHVLGKPQPSVADVETMRKYVKNMIAYLPKDKARSLQIGRNVDKHTQTKHLYAQLELYFTTLNGGSDTYTPIIL